MRQSRSEALTDFTQEQLGYSAHLQHRFFQLSYNHSDDDLTTFVPLLLDGSPVTAPGAEPVTGTLLSFLNTSKSDSFNLSSSPLQNLQLSLSWVTTHTGFDSTNSGSFTAGEFKLLYNFRLLAFEAGYRVLDLESLDQVTQQRGRFFFRVSRRFFVF
jgi:hypothetical protein